MQVFADVGAVDVLTDYFKSGVDFTLQLFTDNASPARGDTNASRTVPDATGGYADKTLTVAGATVSDPAIPQVAWAQQVFTFTGAIQGAGTIYGYQILRGTTLITQELLAVPFTPANNGDHIDITPIIQLGNGDPAA